MAGWVATLNQVPLAGLMLVVALGYSLGRVSLREVSLGPAGATLFVSLALGHLGLALPESTSERTLTLGTLGFALFIYSVGFDAAPHFFSSFRERRGFRFLAVGVAVNGIAVVATLIAAHLLELDGSTSAGLLSGALTSAPTYAAASEVAPDPTALSLAFAITYPFGLAGVVLLVQILPRVLRQDLSQGAVFDGEVSIRPGRGDRGPEDRRVFEVRNAEVVGKPLRELDLIHRTNVVLSRARCGSELLIPDGDTVLESGDHVMARGPLAGLRAFEALVGPEVFDRALHEGALPSRRIQVRDPGVVGRSLQALDLIHRFHCVVVRIERGSLWIEPDAEATLVRDDVIEVVGRPDDLRAVARVLGRFEPSVRETDIAVYAGGIVLGLGLGSIHVRPFGLDLSLGTAGGLLAMGLFLGWQQKLGPLRTYVPREARQLVRDLGILLFVGETGLAAGGTVALGLQQAPGSIFVAGAMVAALAVLGPVILAHSLLGLRPVDAWGSVCGGLTSSAALHAVRRLSDSNDAALSYAAAYGVGSVLATLAGPLVVLLGA